MILAKVFFQLLALTLCVFVFEGCQRNKRAVVKKEKIGSAEIAYYIRGHGEPLVMIMGFRGTMSVWDPALLNELEKNYTLILFDNRGAGLSSDSSDEPLTISQMADDTASLIKALGYKKVHVLGWSMGSRIAMDMAINHSDLLESVILCSPSPGGKYRVPRKTDAYEKLTEKELSEKEALSLLFPETTEGYSAGAMFMARLTEAMLVGAVPRDIIVSNHTIERQIHALKKWEENNNIYDALPNIKIPTLVTGGLDDVLDAPENVQIVANRIPLAWTAYFAGAGHGFHSQYHQKFAQLVTIFIESDKQQRNP